MKRKCKLREILYALDKRWVRYVPSSPILSGSYIAYFCGGVGGGGNKGGGKKRDDIEHDDEEDKDYEEDREYRSVQQSVSNFEVEYDRRPHILVVNMG